MMYCTSGLSLNLLEPQAEAMTTTPIVSHTSQYLRSSVIGIIPAGARSDTTSVLPKAIADNWGKVLRAHVSEAMQSRLIRIASARRGPNAKALTTQSLGDFLDFWNQVKIDAVEPEITVAPDGTLCAEWFRSPQQKLDVRFALGRAVFGLFSRRGILEGSESLGNVALYLRNHSARPLQWSA